LASIPGPNQEVNVNSVSPSMGEHNPGLA
jgi:hypothetical protein